MQREVYPPPLPNIMLNSPEKSPKYRINTRKKFVVFFKELLPILPLFVAFF